MLNTSSAFDKARSILKEASIQIIIDDLTRPWGGYLVIDEAQTGDFIKKFFPDDDFSGLVGNQKLSPKLLIVAPGKRLSWQYHLRRAELWRCLDGKVGVVTSQDDQEDAQKFLEPGQKIELDQGERHRLFGLDDWGIVAEIWIHTDPNHPSDEEDIIRIQDDFNR